MVAAENDIIAKEEYQAKDNEKQDVDKSSEKDGDHVKKDLHELDQLKFDINDIVMETPGDNEKAHVDKQEDLLKMDNDKLIIASDHTTKGLDELVAAESDNDKE